MGIISYVNEEIQVIRERDPAIKSNMEVFLYSSFKAILHYRIAHKLYLKKHYFLARWVSQRAVRKTGIEIQTVIVFYQPVGFEYLTDYFIFLHGLSGKQMIFEKFHLFWWF